MEKIDTPFGIHAEFVSDRAVKNCINMYKKEQKRITPGKNGPRARVSKHLKDSLDLGLEPSEITRLKIYYKELHGIIDNDCFIRVGQAKKSPISIEVHAQAL